MWQGSCWSSGVEVSGMTCLEKPMWQGSRWSGGVEVSGMTCLEKPMAKAGIEPRSTALEADVLPLGRRGGEATELFVFNPYNPDVENHIITQISQLL